jgi:hypothetical protein
LGIERNFRYNNTQRGNESKQSAIRYRYELNSYSIGVKGDGGFKKGRGYGGAGVIFILFLSVIDKKN